jgi:hypothetical protein
MKSFASLHYRGSQTELKIEFERPSFAKFVHELYKHSARKLWQMAYYFKTSGVSSEQQARNRQEIENVVTGCMEHVIRSFLPWESIAKKYFAEDDAPYAPPKSSARVPDPEPVPVVAPKPNIVKFEDDVPEADGSGSDSGSDGAESGEEDRGELKVGDEEAEIEFDDLDKPADTKKEEEDDPLKDIEAKADGDTLVLNM